MEKYEGGGQKDSGPISDRINRVLGLYIAAYIENCYIIREIQYYEILETITL